VGEDRPRFYPLFDAALLISENNKDDLGIYMYRYIRLASKNLGKRISYTEKIYILWLIILEKNLTSLFDGKKNLSSRV